MGRIVVVILGIVEGVERIPGRREVEHIEEQRPIVQERHTVAEVQPRTVAAELGTSAVRMGRSQRWRMRSRVRMIVVQDQGAEFVEGSRTAERIASAGIRLWVGSIAERLPDTAVHIPQGQAESLLATEGGILAPSKACHRASRLAKACRASRITALIETRK